MSSNYSLADKNTPNKKLDLISAVKNSEIENVKSLLDKGAEPNVIDEDWNIPLQLAINSNNVEIVKLLLEHGANSNIPDTHGKESLLMVAIEKNSVEAVKLLLDYGANPAPAIDNRILSPIWYAVFHNCDIEIIKALLDHGINPNIDHTTPSLLGTAVLKNPEMVQVLLERGADANAGYDSSGYTTPLLQAIGSHPWGEEKKETDDEIKIVKLLLEHGADPNKADNRVTPLIAAASHEKTGAVELLLAKGINPNIQEWMGKQTALHFAVKKENTAIVKLLLDNSADPNIQDSKGRTPISYAAQNGNMAIVHLLLSNNANPTIADEIGLNAIEYASIKYKELAELMEQFIKTDTSLRFEPKRTQGEKLYSSSNKSLFFNPDTAIITPEQEKNFAFQKRV